MILAMHMANELLNIPIAAVTILIAAGFVAIAAALARRSLTTERLPLMGVVGAFVFAAQMINFTLPGMPGTSGHLGGGVLLAIILGPWAAIVAMAAILVVQCLLFQDGGLLALGCNILNMGVVPCLTGWGLYRALLGPVSTARPWRQYLAAWAACILGVAGGAALVPFEAGFSGVLRVPTVSFLALMVGVHLIIGFVEGLITFVVVAYLRQVRPVSLGLAAADASGGRLSRGMVAASLLATAALLAAVVAWFASASPDGLEWCTTEHRWAGADRAVEEPSSAVAAVNAWQTRWSLMPDYSRRPAPLGEDPAAPASTTAAKASVVKPWGSLAGLLGTAVTLGIVWSAATLLRRRKTIRSS